MQTLKSRYDNKNEGAKPPRAPPFDSDKIIFCERFKYFFCQMVLYNFAGELWIENIF
jgi:hypothetical protein